MKVIDYINFNEVDSYFILDSHIPGVREAKPLDQDFISYHYNLHKYNKLRVNSFVIFRRPTRSSDNGKFFFYGGAIIESIIPDGKNDGGVNATLKKSFKFNVPLYEDDQNCLDFRNARNPGKTNWANFWNQYGMSEYSRELIEILINGKECEPVGVYTEKNSVIQNDISPIEENQSFDNTDMGNYEISLTESGRTSKNGDQPFKAKIGKHFDYDKLNQTRRTIGKAGEVLVLNYEFEKLAGTPYKPEYIAETQGDGTGYDIKSYDTDGNEIWIEVKTTTSNKIDGFYLTENERCVAENNQEKYKIYRVYNLNKKTKTANIQIFNNIIGEDFELKPKSYQVYIK